MFRINLKNGIDKSLDNNDHLYKLKEDINFFDYVSSQSSTKKYVEVMKSLVKKQIKDYL